MKRKKTRGRHLLLGKSHSRMGRIKGTAVVENGLQQRLEKLLPYA
jgi:ribosomal protein L35